MESAPGCSPSPLTPEVKNEERVYGTPMEKANSAFGRRNPLLAAFIPDFLEDAVDVMLPDAFEARMERGAQKAARRYARMRSDFKQGVGEIASALLRVAKYALHQFDVGDVVFGIYSLAQQHAATGAEDAIEGRPVTSPVLLKWLLHCTNIALAAYCPSKAEYAAAARCQEEDIVELNPSSDSARPAYTMSVDHSVRHVVLAFRGTTDLNDMLTDACAACVPYMGGYAHQGMMKAARWFVKNKLHPLRELCDAHPGYGLLLVGHSLGAGTATLVAHLIKQGDRDAGELMKGIKIHAVGIACPAVLTADLADNCSQYISSVVLSHDLVPRFSVYNAWVLHQEVEATGWQERVKARIKDYAVPDFIEHSAAYKWLSRSSRRWVGAAVHYLAVVWLAIMQWIVTALEWMGAGRPLDAPDRQEGEGESPVAAPAEPHRSAGQMMKDAARATAAAALHVMHHPGLSPATVAAIEKACREAAQGDVHAVYAPGRLYFLRRTDPPQEEAERLRKAAAAKRAARKASGSKKKAGKSGSSSDEEEDAYPGATFELIRGSREQRFKRIVLQQTCLMDHMCTAYCTAVERLLDGQGVERVKPEQGEQAKEEQQEEEDGPGKRKEE